MYPVALILIASVGATVQAGCHTMRFELSNAEHKSVVYDRKSFFLWGLTPTQKVDVTTHCPAGVAAIRERMTFTDGLLGFATLGIWQPRSSWYYCLAYPEDPERVAR
jgi:hypothetical protein